jgi:hypothetical protein
MAKMVQMKATGFFTRNSPTTAAILHGDDRKEADVAARFPLVSEDDAAFLEAQGLAKPYTGTVPAETGSDGTGMTIDERAGVMVEHYAEDEDSVEAPTGLDTRNTTAFENPLERIAGAVGGRSLTATDKTGAPVGEEEAPAGGGRDGQGVSREGQQRASGGRSSGGRRQAADSGSGGKSGSDGQTDTNTEKPLGRMTTAELDAEAKTAGVDQAAYDAAKNNDERADLIQKARDAKAGGGAST